MFGPLLVKVSNVYRKLPLKPFRSLARLSYRKYINKHSLDVVRVQRDGIDFELHLNEVIEHHIYYNGVFEKKTHEALLELSKPGMTIFDVGANIGVHTFYMARNILPGGHVYAFEPATYAFKKLSINTELNPTLPVTLVNAGLSNENIDRLKTEVACSWPVNSNFDRRDDQAMASSLVMDDEITLVKMDDYVEKNNINKIDLIKLDIDGNEPKFIEGAKATISRDKPILVFELADYVLRHYGSSAEELLDHILGLGYKVYDEDFVELSKGVLKQFENEKENYSINLIAVHEDSNFRF